MSIKSFLFENTGVRQIIFKNTLWLATTEIITQLLKLVLIVYMARILGAEEYGKFSFALSFVTMLVIFAGLGLDNIITREFSRSKEAEKDYPSIISLKLFLSIGVFLLMYIGSFFITQEPSIRKSIWLLGAFILITSFLNIFYAFFHARQKMEYEAFFKIVQYVVLTIFSFLVLFIVPSIENISFAFLATNFITLAFILIFFHFFIRSIKLEYNKNIWRKFISFSWPLTLGVIIGWIYAPVSSVMLGYFGYNTENGWYSAAYKIIGAFVISVILVSRSFFPAINKASAASKERLQRIWNYQKELMIICAFPFIAGGMALASKIINFFYDSSFAPSIPIFQWMAFVFAIDFLYYPYATALIIFGQEKRNFVLIIAGLALNIVLNIVLIPVYKLQGVMVSNLISSLTVFLLAVFAVMRYTPISPLNFKIFKTLLAVVFSSTLMFFIVKLPVVYNLNLFALITIGMLSYFFIFIVCYWFLNKNAYKEFINVLTGLKR